ncbi:class I SAM-dependent methyltransferase [Stutzerimonas tarimensis]|uniref:SAM-dependent methyltransferase n=1 Tax=Stutzerimonas tarimensis TaxID=1507735 RepID=A0ABV7T734_9GAMM
MPLASVRSMSARALPALLLAASLPLQAQITPPQLDVPYVPTPEPVVARMLEMADVQPEDYVIDLGSGDGRIAIAAVRDFDARQALGVDLNPVRVSEAVENAERAGVTDRVTFEEGDLFEKDISDATVLTMYLLPRVNLQLRPVILDTLEPGTRVVSHAFSMDEWEPDDTDVVSNSYIYLWIVPAKVDGDWQISTPEGDFSVSLMQQFQMVEGVAEGLEPGIVKGRLNGTQIEFTLDDRHYVGTVNGDSIEPVSMEGAVANWSARRN